MLQRSQISWVCMPSVSAAGTSKPPVPPAGTACMRAWTGSPTSWRTRNDPFHQFWFFFFCLLFIFSVSTQRQHRIQAPSLPSNPKFKPQLFLSRTSFIPSLLLLPTPTPALVPRQWGSSLCCLCVRGRACVRVCVPCVFSECVWVWRRLCVCWLGLGVTLACLLHTSCGISSLVFKPLSPSTKLSLCPTQPTPTLSLARPPSPPPLLSRGSMVFIRQRKSKGASSPPPLPVVYIC